ncbi:hypothetical protein OIE66_15200 [Nonomuraea sp. NBC_01738]|uniref:effector-associated constant component EACC1 n=1 Tax=Nonomuraea sp. NBC_01738 TaxID=2976003 RepID=UPI002E103F1F|nr:hypothetical protein OIE66_15200 [Nonomuraea sp. NBC_01738]
MPAVAFQGDHDDLHSLHEWLRDSDVLRGLVTLVTAPPAPGRMGEEPALLVGVEAEAQAAALSRTVELWPRMRGPGVTLKLRVGLRVTELDLRGDLDLDAVVRQVDALLRDAVRGAQTP